MNAGTKLPARYQSLSSSRPKLEEMAELESLDKDLGIFDLKAQTTSLRGCRELHVEMIREALQPMCKRAFTPFPSSCLLVDTDVEIIGVLTSSSLEAEQMSGQLEERVRCPQKRSNESFLSERPFTWATLGYTRPTCIL
jgi:hypothetical protein